MKPEPTRSENGNIKPKQPIIRKDPRDPKNFQRNIRAITKQDDIAKPTTNPHSRGVTRARGFRGVGRGGQTRSKPPQDDNNDYIMSQNFTNKNINQQVMSDVEKDMSNMNIQEGSYGRGGKFNNSRQASVPPRLQAEQRGSKRYSSLRQRSLPETAANQSGNFNQQHTVIHYQPGEYLYKY